MQSARSLARGATPDARYAKALAAFLATCACAHKGAPPPSDIPTDPTYGYDLERLKQVRPPQPPKDFKAFWEPRYARAVALPPNLALGPPKQIGTWSLYEAHFDGIGGKRLGGYLALPANQPIASAVLYLHGYGGNEEPTEEDLAENAPTTAMLFTCIRGFGLSADANIPGDSSKHVVMNIEDPNEYQLGYSVADVWSSASALLAAAPAAKDRLYLDGTSFGGGIGAMALAWDKRFAKGYLEVPTFGHQPLRMQLPTYGSAHAVQQYLATTKHPEKVWRTLSYFDAASSARFITTPTMYTCALADTSVAPPGQFAVYNVAGGEKHLTTMSLGHADIPDEETAQLRESRRRWLGL
jgi:cephalosporin-C deacetylase